MFKPEYRPAQRDAFCRSCEQRIPKGTNMVSWYSYLNTGMHIHLCVSCVKKLQELIPNERT